MKSFSTHFPPFAQRPFRRWGKLAFSTFGLVIILAGAFFAVARYQAAHAASAKASSCGSWTIVASPSPNTNLNILYSVSAVSANGVWAVGYSDNSNGNISTLIEHWDGSQWSVVSSPNLGPKNNELYSVTAISTNDVWAVGSYSPKKDMVGLIEHWDGAAWSVVPAQKPIKQGFILNAITAVSATNLWAVGRRFGTSGNQTIIEHWSGTAWRIVASPNPNAQDDILEGVTAVSSSNVWAVGEQNFTSATLIEHWNGSAWSVVPSPSPNSVIDELVAATNVDSKDVWTVGNDGGEHLLIEQWNGSQWNVKQSAKGMTGFLNGTVAVSGHNVWAVGIGSNGSQAAQAISEQWNGAKWSFVTTPNPGTHSVLRGIAVIPGTSNLWSVGDYETGGSSSSNTLAEFYQSCS
jgi:hypothetical protein